MTMIAHGILALREYLAKKEQKELENKLKAELFEEGRQALEAKLEKASKKVSQRSSKMKKLERIEKKIDIFFDYHRLTYGGPFALGRTLACIVVAVPVASAVLVAMGIDESAKKIKELKTKKEEQKLAASIKAKEEAKRIAKENKEKAEESAEITEINLLKELISNADMIQTRSVDIPTDKNAIVVGLIDEAGQIAEFASKLGRMLFFFDNKPEAKIVNAFFVNPDTGNFEEIATVKSVRGRKQIVDLINSQLDIKKQKHKEHEEAQIRNAEIMRKMKER